MEDYSKTGFPSRLRGEPKDRCCRSITGVEGEQPCLYKCEERESATVKGVGEGKRQEGRKRGRDRI